MVLLVAAAGTVGLALYVKMTPADRVRPIERPAEPPPSMEPPPAKGVQVLIPTAEMADGTLRFGQRAFTIPDGSDPQVEAVNEFLRESRVLPDGAKLLRIDLEDGEAALHFTKEIEGGQGSFDEATLIQGLRAVLGQFPTVQRFRLFSENGELRELGHFELGDPIHTLPVSRWNEPEGSDETPPPSMPR
jgi:hypothetical protein